MTRPKPKGVVLVLLAVATTGLTLMMSSLVFGDHENAKPRSHGAAHIIVAPDEIKWADAPPGLPPGAKVAVLEGDPSKPAPFTMRAKFPAGYRIPAHWHPADERVTVLSGAIFMGMGDKLDTTRGHKVPPGGFALMPAKVHHFAWTEEETIIQLNGIGPWAIIYLDAADGPAKLQTSPTLH